MFINKKVDSLEILQRTDLSCLISYNFYSCGGFNTPTLCVVTKGIKAEGNHLMRTTYPDACVGVVDFKKTFKFFKSFKE